MLANRDHGLAEQFLELVNFITSEQNSLKVGSWHLNLDTGTKGFLLMYPAHTVVADFVDKMQWWLSAMMSVKCLYGAK